MEQLKRMTTMKLVMMLAFITLTTKEAQSFDGVDAFDKHWATKTLAYQKCMAQINGYSTIAELLHNPESNVTIPVNIRYEALCWAHKCGHGHIERALLNYAHGEGEQVDNINSLFSELFKRFHDNKKDDLDIVRLFLQNNAGPDTRINHAFGEYPIIYAGSLGYTNLAKLLIEFHVNVDIASYHDSTNGETALARGCNGNYCDFLELIIKHGADVNRVDGKGKTPLQYCRGDGAVAARTILLENGAIETTAG